MVNFNPETNPIENTEKVEIEQKPEPTLEELLIAIEKLENRKFGIENLTFREGDPAKEPRDRMIEKINEEIARIKGEIESKEEPALH